MRIFHIADMVRGWYVGDFTPTAFRTQACEAALIRHEKDEEWPRHRHNIAVEINLLLRGALVIDQGELGRALVRAGDIFVLAPGETMKPEFITDCELVTLKIPSLPHDKEVVDED